MTKKRNEVIQSILQVFSSIFNIRIIFDKGETKLYKLCFRYSHTSLEDTFDKNKNEGMGKIFRFKNSSIKEEEV